MDAELKRKWVEALRSGRYKQCKASLYDGKNYCCLGVLHRVALKTKPPYLWDEIPYKLMDAGIGHEDSTTLSEMNDSGKTFPEIADYIEANL